MEDINLTLDKSIREKNMKSIRNILSTSMVQDPGFNKGIFEESLKRCFSAGLSETDIFEPFQGEPYNDDQSTWTKNYYAEQCTKFRSNFSRERLEHLIKVGKKLFPAAVSPASSYQKEDKRKNEDSLKWLVPVGIGAAAILLLWLLFGRK